MPLHNTLTGSELHEPKGVASASEGMAYVADGSGSGTWKYSPTGYVRYQDTTDQTFTTTYSKLLVDGSGSNSTELYLPRAIRGLSSLWSTGLNKITPIAEGDAYIMRVDLPITATSGAIARIEFVLDIGGAATPTIPIVERDITISKTPPFRVSFSFNFDSLDTFFANGGQIFLRSDAGTATVSDPVIQITRIHGEI